MEYIEFDSVPAFEDCQQVGPDYRPELAKIEAQVYARQIQQQFPNFDKVKIQVKTSYGNYTTFFVRIGFDPNCKESIRQAFEIEETAWDKWTKENKRFLQNMISVACSDLFAE